MGAFRRRLVLPCADRVARRPHSRTPCSRAAPAPFPAPRTVCERAVQASFMVSADMAHGVHPNYSDKHERHHRPLMHKGLVIKHNANQRYMTNGVSASIFREIGMRAGLPVQGAAPRGRAAKDSSFRPFFGAGRARDGRA